MVYLRFITEISTVLRVENEWARLLPFDYR